MEKPLTGQELADWEAGRDLVAEINESVDQILDGVEVPVRVVCVSEEVHEKRMRAPE